MNEDKKMARRKARETVFELLYETEYHKEDTPEEIFALSCENRDIDETDKYIRRTYFGVKEQQERLDILISRHAKGWKTNRLSRMTRTILRLGTYEMACGNLPAPVAINEAVELSKKFDDPTREPGRTPAYVFINGVLNAIKTDLAENGIPELPAPVVEETVAVEAQAETEAEVIVETPAAEENND